MPIFWDLIKPYIPIQEHSIQSIKEHYFHYNGKRATEALPTGRKRLKSALGNDWMRDSCPYIDDN